MIYNLPTQKVVSSKKNTNWFKDCVVGAVNIALNEKNSIKPSNENIKENFDIYDGDIKAEKVRERFTTSMLKNKDLNPRFDHFSVIRDRIDELVGEFIEKDNEYVIAALNSEAISEKIEERKKKAFGLLVDLIGKKDLTEEMVTKQLQEFSNAKFLSKAEIVANRVLSYYRGLYNLSYLEFEAFREVLITAVVTFYVGIEHGRLVIRKPSPENIFAVRNGQSSDIRDAEIIVEVEYLPKGKILDKYAEVLTETQIKKILDTGFESSAGAIESKKELVFDTMEELNRFTQKQIGGGSIDEYIDDDGNIRVAKASWKGYRKIYHRQYNDEFGDIQYDYVSEKHKADLDKGEVLNAMWVTEWHEGDLVGSDMVLNAKVREVQLRDPDMPFESFSGYVGEFFNVGKNKARSMIDMVKTYIYFRDMLFARIEDVLATNTGKVINLDLSKMPTGWSLEKWYSMIKVHRIKVTDSFKEGDKGFSTGKLAGQYNSPTRVDDMDTSSSITVYLNMIGVVDQMISRATGVTDQRLGAIAQHELVGNVNRSMVQSSLVTEIWFKKFELVLLKFYELIIESSKAVLNSDTRLQTVLDDFSHVILDSFDSFKLSTFGLLPVNARKYDELKNIIKQTAVNAIPNGQMTITQLASIYKSGTVFDMLNTQEKLEAANAAKAEEMREQDYQRQMEAITAQAEVEDRKLQKEQDFEFRLEEMKQAYKLELERIKLEDKVMSDAFSQYYKDSNENGVDDTVEIIKQRMINMQKDKELAMKDKEINLKFQTEILKSKKNLPTK